MKKMQKELEVKQQKIIAAQCNIELLEKQLRELQRAKEELEEKQKDLQETMDYLEASYELDAEETQKIADEIR